MDKQHVFNSLNKVNRLYQPAKLDKETKNSPLKNHRNGHKRLEQIFLGI